MIVKRILVSGWKCFAEPFEVGPFSEGLNILYAPNAFGKSTLFDALVRALFDSHRATGPQVDALRSWGRSLSPSVAVDFHHDGFDYRISKRFLDDPASALLLHEDAGLLPLAESDDADRKVRELLSGKPASNGLSNAANWGICQVLWAPQGELSIRNVSDDIITNIKDSLDAQIAGNEAVLQLEDRIRKAYERYFNDKGELRTGKDGSPLIRIQEELEHARGEYTRVYESVRSFEEASSRLRELSRTMEEAGERRNTIKAALAEQRELARDYAAVKSRYEKLRKEADACEARHSELKQRLEIITSLRAQTAEHQAIISNAESREPDQRKERKEWSKELKNAKHALALVRENRVELELLERELSTARDFVQVREHLAVEKAKRKEIAVAKRRLSSARTARKKIFAPDAGELREIKAAVARRDDLAKAMLVPEIVVELTPEGSVQLESASGPELLEAGATHRIQGRGKVSFSVKGFGSVQALNDGTDAAAAAKELRAAKTRVTKLTQKYGTSDPMELEALSESAISADSAILAAESTLNALLSGIDEKALKDRIKGLEARARELAEEAPSWHKSPPKIPKLEQVISEARAEYEASVSKQEARYDAAVSSHASAESAHSSTTGTIAFSRARIAEYEDRINALSSPGQEDKALQAKLGTLFSRLAAAEKEALQAKDALNAYSGDPAKTVRKLVQELEEAEALAEATLVEAKTEEGKVEQLTTGGCYSRLAVVEERLALLEEALTAEELHEESVKLLHNTIEHCRQEALNAVERPVGETASEIMQRIAGAEIGGVNISRELTPKGMKPAAVPEIRNISMNELSGGEQEQIHFAVRLALADTLAMEGRQLVVLDDALTATDSWRFSRILELLQEMASRLQLIILTCHPEKYAHSVEATFFDLGQTQAKGR